MKLPPCPCPHCGITCNAATDLAHPTRPPQQGDISICLYCGHIMAFAANLTLRHLTAAEMCKIAGDKRILTIQKARLRCTSSMPRPAFP